MISFPPVQTTVSPSVTSAVKQVPEAQRGVLRIHFLNVGHGDCTIIEHPSGRNTMVDIHNGDDIDPTTYAEIQRVLAGRGIDATLRLLEARQRGWSRYESLVEGGYDIALTNPVSFFKRLFPNLPIFRYVQTHPQLDHMRGLASLRISGIPVLNLWDTYHNRSTPNFQSDGDRRDWAEYERLRTGIGGATVLRLTQGASGTYWNEEPASVAGGDGIEILAPTDRLVSMANHRQNWNLLSFVLRIEHAGIITILGGDADGETWDEILRTVPRERLKCHLLKASHHGRDSGYHQEAVKTMSPDYTIVSVGTKPETDATNKYRQYSKHVWSTRWKGNVTMSAEFGRATIASQYDR